MIVRVLTARVGSANAGAFNVSMRETLEELRRQPGLAYVKLARRLLDDGEEVVLFQEWLTPADLYRWTGGDLHRPRLGPGANAMIIDLVITHYESLDRTPEEMGLELLEEREREGSSGVSGREAERSGAGGEAEAEGRPGDDRAAGGKAAAPQSSEERHRSRRRRRTGP